MNVSCKKCGTPVKLDPANKYKLLLTFGISESGITEGLGDIVKVKSPTGGVPLFFCPTCKGLVEMESLVGSCYECGTVLPVADLYKTKGIGGCFCKAHAPDGGKISLSTILSRWSEK